MTKYLNSTNVIHNLHWKSYMTSIFFSVKLLWYDAYCEKRYTNKVSEGRYAGFVYKALVE